MHHNTFGGRASPGAYVLPMGVNATGTLGVAASQIERRRRENRGGDGVGSGEGLCPLPENLWIFHLKMVWYGADENDSDLRYSEVIRRREKNQTLVKILGGRQHSTTPAGQILGVATPAALTPIMVLPMPLCRNTSKGKRGRKGMGRESPLPPKSRWVE